MSSAPILGPIAFKGFEVPERISFGGRQKLVIHQLPGGHRVIDTLGADEGPIKWSGVFSGVDAGERVRTLDMLRKLGATLLLTWDGWRFLVIIQAFRAEVANSNWVPYEITLCVAPSPLDVAIDWLASVAAPVLSVATLPTAALQSLLTTSGAGLTSGSLPDVVSAAGNQAQAVTALAYSGALA